MNKRIYIYRQTITQVIEIPIEAANRAAADLTAQYIPSWWDIDIIEETKNSVTHARTLTGHAADQYEQAQDRLNENYNHRRDAGWVR